MHIRSRIARLLAHATVIGLLLGGSALAHAKLISSDPGPGSSGAAPAELTLTFNEVLNLSFSGVKLTDPDGATIETGEVALSDDNKGMVVPILGQLASGEHSVEWNVLSSDGHKLKGIYSFIVAP